MDLNNTFEWPYQPQEGPQTELWNALSPMSPYRYIGFGGPRGGGKANRNSSLVLTPYGFRQMGDLKVGDRICDTDGSIQRVLQVHPQGEQDIYKVSFSTGAETYVTLDHLWTASISSNSRKRDGKKVTIMEKFTTAQLKAHIDKNKGQNANRHPLIPLPDPVKFTKSYRNNPRNIHPYLLGLLIGDGCITGTRNPSLTSGDSEIIEWVERYCKENGWNYNTSVRDNCSVVSIKSSELIKYLKILNLFETDSLSKFIPKPYLYGSVDDRIELVRGLMDTDGYVDDRGHMSYTSVSMQLAKDFQWLIRSLGGKAAIWSGEGAYRDNNGKKIVCNDAHNVQFNTKINPELVTLPRKKERTRDIFNGGVSDLKLRMESIDFSHREEATCITVSNANSLYITDDFIVTHNSFGMRSWFVTACWQFPIEATIIRRKRSDLVDNHINAFKLEMKPFIESGYLKYNERDAAAYFQNGSILYFSYCDSKEDLEGIQGKAYDLLGIEESTQLEEHYINVIISSNRPSNVANKFRTKYRPKALQTFNWGGRSHEFHRRIFWDKEYDLKNEDPEDFHFIFAPLKYNKVLLENDPNYAKQLRRLPEQLQKAWIDGDPDAFTGSMFKIVDDFHVVDQTELLEPFGGVIPDHWKLFGSLDAATGDFCSFGLYTKSPAGFIYKIFTYYVKNTSPQDHVDSITERILRCPYTDGRKPGYILADRHAFQRRSKTMIGAHDITWKDLFSDKGLFLRRAVDDRIAGAMAMVHALDYKYNYDMKSLIRAPKLQFFKETRNGTNSPTIKELLALERDHHNPEDIDQAAPDHAYDETRYAVMGALTPRELGQEVEKEPARHKDYGSHVPIEEKMPSVEDAGDQWEGW